MEQAILEELGELESDLLAEQGAQEERASRAVSNALVARPVNDASAR